MNFIKNFFSHFQNTDGSSTKTPKAGELNPANVSNSINHITDINEDLLTSQSSDELPMDLEASETNSNDDEKLKIVSESLDIDDATSKKILENYNIDETLTNLNDFEDLYKNIADIEDVIVADILNSQNNANFIENEDNIVNLDELDNIFEPVNDIEVNPEVTKTVCKASITEEDNLEDIEIGDSTESSHVLEIDGNKDNVTDIQFASRVSHDDRNYSVCNDSHMPGKHPKHYLDEFKSFLKNNNSEAKTKTYFAMTNVSPHHLNVNIDSENNLETSNCGHNALDAGIDTSANEGKIIHEVIETQNKTSISKENEEIDKETSVIILSSEDDTNSKLNETKAYDNISSISSEDERERERADSDYCSGYNSSDFEFITESEAKLDGLIINVTSKALKTPEKRHNPETYTVEIAKDANYVSGSSQESVKEVKPGPSHSKDLNHAKEQNYKDGLLHKNVPATSTTNPKDGTYKERNYSYDYRRYLFQESRKQRQNHVMPQGEDYLNLFQGMYMPLVPELHLLENKSVRPRTCMNLEYEGIGFDTRLVKITNDSDDEYKDEAEETTKKIMSMYPGENRKRRRRY